MVLVVLVWVRFVKNNQELDILHTINVIEINNFNSHRPLAFPIAATTATPFAHHLRRQYGGRRVPWQEVSTESSEGTEGTEGTERTEKVGHRGTEDTEEHDFTQARKPCPTEKQGCPQPLQPSLTGLPPSFAISTQHWRAGLLSIVPAGLSRGFRVASKICPGKPNQLKAHDTKVRPRQAGQVLWLPSVLCGTTEKPCVKGNGRAGCHRTARGLSRKPPLPCGRGSDQNRPTAQRACRGYSSSRLLIPTTSRFFASLRMTAQKSFPAACVFQPPAYSGLPMAWANWLQVAVPGPWSGAMVCTSSL